MARRAPRYDIVLAVRRFSARDQGIHQLLGPLEARLDRALLIGADAYYRHATDVAVIVLQIDTRYVTGPLLSSIQRDAVRAGAAMFELSKLSDQERDRFENRYLPGQDIALRDLPSLEDAVELLADKLEMQLSTTMRAARVRVEPPSVRFRRGDRWERGRLCKLTSEGIYIATGGPPRAGDRAQIEVTGPRGRVVVTAMAVQVTPEHAAREMGQSGFAARFVFKDAAEQRAAAPLLEAARDAVVKTSRPPRRRHTRFPLRWPAFIAQGTSTTAIRVLDISEGGMFAETASHGSCGDVSIVLPYDGHGAPVRLAARVARMVSPASVIHPDGASGVGVEVVRGDQDDDRYIDFVDRVARRSAMRIVVGAAAERLDPLLEALMGVGYVVSGATAPSVVYDRVTETQDPPELVVIDDSIEDGNIRAARSLQRALSTRNVNTLRVDNKNPVNVRQLIDAALVG